MLKGPKNPLNLHGSIFATIFYRSERKELEKFCLSSTSNVETVWECWEHLLTVNILKGSKLFLNLRGSIFVIFFDHSERKSARKILC